MNILEKIVANKKLEIIRSKATIGIGDLEKSFDLKRKTISLHKALIDGSTSGIIAEFKRKSPSKGIINDQVLPEIVTKGYADAGASGLSVLTDFDFFGGDFGDFRAARLANPTTAMLRKDFMIDEYQLYEAKALGADVILLIAACLTPNEVINLGKKAQEMDMEVLLEVHDAQELNQTLCEYVNIVGVNNRNLKTFETDIQTSMELAKKIPDSFAKISESGLENISTILKLREVGYNGFLIGETFMKTANPAVALKELLTL